MGKEEDTAGLNRLEKYSLVYLVKKEGQLDKVILPIRGKGLWSTLYGYLALSADLSTISGITFYEHGETPAWAARLIILTGRLVGLESSSMINRERLVSRL